MTSSDAYTMHRLALRPLIAENPQEPFDTAGSAVSAADEKQFLNFILQQNLGPLWHEALKKSDPPLFSADFRNTMKEERFRVTAQYLRQQHAVRKINDVLNSESIPYVVFKGAHIRELIYTIPAVRPAADIDILVSKTRQEAAIKSLVSAGYAFRPLAENISHEATLTDGRVSIDLHWDIMRPGRTRRDMTDKLLATRTKFPEYWGLSDEAALFIMLVHPVFTKYLNSPGASLMRTVDLAYWIKQRQPNWDAIYSLLNQAGLYTAAWTTLEWLKILTDSRPPAPFIEKIEPGRLKAAYLRFWINQNFSTRFFSTPTVIKVAFTLPVHDTISDAIRALHGLAKAKQSAKKSGS